MNPEQIRLAMLRSAELHEERADLIQEDHSRGGDWDERDGMDKLFVKLMRTACDLRIAARFVK